MWSSKTTYVDVDGGEIIDKSLALKQYTIIKTSTNVTFNHNRTKGYIERTKYCQRTKQQSLW